MKSSRNKPFYKQLSKLRNVIPRKDKITKLNKRKWQRVRAHWERQTAIPFCFHVKDQFRPKINKFLSRGNSFRKVYKNDLLERKAFRLSYGGNLRKKYLKAFIKSASATSQVFQNRLESRLDIVINKAKFSPSIQSARQLILHGHVLVNNKQARIPSSTLNFGDKVTISPNEHSQSVVKKTILKTPFWPIPPKHLQINYKVLGLVFLLENRTTDRQVQFNSIDLNRVISTLKRC